MDVCSLFLSEIIFLLECKFTKNQFGETRFLLILLASLEIIFIFF